MKLPSRLLTVVFTGLILTVPSLAQYPQMKFPMHAGDYWQFSEVPGIVSEAWVVGDTVFPSGLNYSIFGGTLLGGYYRMEGPRLYQFRPSADVLLCDFSGKPGDSLGFYRNFTDTTIVSVRDQGLWNCFDDLRFQMRFFHRSMHSPGIIRAQYQVADSIGFVAIDQETVHFRLVGAIINGRQFGVITVVARASYEIPEKEHLSQNYPNPFNPSTTIHYELPKSANVSLRIFNTLGQLVATLVDEHKAAGYHQVEWNAANVPTCIYFYRLQAGEFVETKKMLLLK